MLENKSDTICVKELLQPLLKIFESHSAVRTPVTKPPGIFRAKVNFRSIDGFFFSQSVEVVLEIENSSFNSVAIYLGHDAVCRTCVCNVKENYYIVKTHKMYFFSFLEFMKYSPLLVLSIVLLNIGR